MRHVDVDSFGDGVGNCRIPGYKVVTGGLENIVTSGSWLR